MEERFQSLAVVKQAKPHIPQEAREKGELK